MAEPDAKRDSKRRTRTVIAAASVIFVSACSGSIGGRPDATRQSPGSHAGPLTAAPENASGPPTSVVPGSSGEQALGTHQVEKDTSIAARIAVRPALTAELVRLRRLAGQRTLGRELPADSDSELYESPESTAHATTQSASEGGSTSDDTTGTSVRADTPKSMSPIFGRFMAIENEAALDRFHRALLRLADGTDEDGKVRILAYGASHTQADVYTGCLRAYLQSRFGDGGQGFVLLGRVNPWYRTLDTSVRHHALAVLHARYRLDVVNEPLGLFGAAFVGARGDSFGEITTSDDSPNTRFELQYLRQPNGGDLRLQVDGKSVALVETKANAVSMGFYPFDTAPGRHGIRVQARGNGPVRLFGVVAETATSGVVLDTLGISGAQLSSHLRWDEAVWTEAARRRAPDLVTFAYGTNELKDPGFSMAQYERHLRDELGRVRRALSDVSCLLISPFDVPERKGGRWVDRQRLLHIIDAQRRISSEFGCGFWDGYAFMGGSGSMHRWVTAKPPLARADHIHLTRLGYVYAGAAIGDALMRAFDLRDTQSARAAAESPAFSPGLAPP